MQIIFRPYNAFGGNGLPAHCGLKLVYPASLQGSESAARVGFEKDWHPGRCRQRSSKGCNRGSNAVPLDRLLWSRFVRDMGGPGALPDDPAIATMWLKPPLQQIIKPSLFQLYTSL